METTTSSSTAVSSKKQPFSYAERKLVIALVQERPVIEDKRTNAINIELKRQAWEDLAVAFNSQPYVTQRSSHQLKRCWENIKTQRKKELSQESSMKHTVGGPPENGSLLSSDNVVETICPFINLRAKRTKANMEQEHALHQLRIQRENILIERENNLLEYEKELHDLQIQKIKLEIELLKKQVDD